MLSGYVAAQKDVWIIGDAFASDAFYIFTKIRESSKESQRPAPYLYQFYNVTCFTENPVSAIDNILA